MAKAKKVGVCHMCAYGGDSTPKKLVSSHVIPRNTFIALGKRVGSKLKKRYIEMPSGTDTPLDITQDQGDEPMLCRGCDNRLGTEIERPTRDWINGQTSRKSVDVDSVLLARYAASVWWRAMLSNHLYFQHIAFEGITIRPLMEASLNKDKTFKNISFRLRRFTDSGGLNDKALLGYTATVAGPLIDERLVQGCACFALIHDGFVWEVFSPRLHRSKIEKLDCFKRERRRYALTSLDFSKTPTLLEHTAQSLGKHEQGKVTPAFEKVYPAADY